MSDLSILIPVRGEQMEVAPGETVLARTVRDLYEKAAGEIEVIVCFDGPPYQDIPAYPNLTVMKDEWAGTKVALNRMAAFADGKYIMKLDGHCMVAPGFDETLELYMQDNYVVMPRMYILDAENWKWQDERYYDYFRLPSPFNYKRGFMFQAGGHWPERNEQRANVTPLDENMKLHGSCWVMARDFYWKALGGLDPNNGAGSWNGEDIEITMKTWLGGQGKLMVNKATWFAHMHRGGQRPREWQVDTRAAYRSAAWTADYWMANSWMERAHDIEWLIDKFWPIPGWTENWKEQLEAWRAGRP